MTRKLSKTPPKRNAARTTAPWPEPSPIWERIVEDLGDIENKFWVTIRNGSDEEKTVAANLHILIKSARTALMDFIYPIPATPYLRSLDYYRSHANPEQARAHLKAAAANGRSFMAKTKREAWLPATGERLKTLRSIERAVDSLRRHIAPGDRLDPLDRAIGWALTFLPRWLPRFVPLFPPREKLEFDKAVREIRGDLEEGPRITAARIIVRCAEELGVTAKAAGDWFNN